MRGHQINKNSSSSTKIILGGFRQTVQTPRRRPSPLLPAEVVVGAEHQEEAQDGPEDDHVPRQHQRARPPGDLQPQPNSTDGFEAAAVTEDEGGSVCGLKHRPTSV